MPAAAEARFTRLLRTCPMSQHGHAYGWETLATYHVRAGRTDDACLAYANASIADPENPRYWNNAGKLHAEAGRFLEAEECFRESVRTGPERPNAWLGLGMVLTQRGAYDEAAESLTAGLRLKPDHAIGWYTLGVAQAAREETERRGDRCAGGGGHVEVPRRLRM